ncbi:hypothetical protein HYU22_00090 [Candidatus Woesearchaeota archaeon]|nr:hypothetical protein [Candidatus Woesearchaeota archaeon]
MLFENPVFKELRLLFGLLTELKNKLELLEEYLLVGKGEMESLEKSLLTIISELQKYGGYELDLLQKADLSKHCYELINKVKNTFTADLFREIFSTSVIPKSVKIKRIKDLIGKILVAEEIIENTKQDLKSELKQKARAEALAKPRLSFHERGCYHFVPIERLAYVFGKGILSYEELTLDRKGYKAGFRGRYQGLGNISVFDPYSYYRLYLSLAKYGKVQALKEGKISEDDIRQALHDNPKLNMSRFAEENIRCLLGKATDEERYQVGTYHGGLLGIEKGTIIDSFIFAAEMDFSVSLFRSYSSMLGLVIDDTAHLFPKHLDFFICEALFIGNVGAGKIMGILCKETSRDLPYVLEFAKFVGVPLYNENGKLIWPI